MFLLRKKDMRKSTYPDSGVAFLLPSQTTSGMEDHEFLGEESFTIMYPPQWRKKYPFFALDIPGQYEHHELDALAHSS